MLQARLEGRRKTIQKYCKEHEVEIGELKQRIARTADDLQDVREEIQTAAIQAGLDDPFEAIDSLRAELASTEAELEAAGNAEEGGGGGGFLGMLKGAAKKAGDMAKQGQLKLKINQIKSKLEAATQVPGEVVVETLTSFDFGIHLQEDVRRSRHLKAALEFHRAEEAELDARLKRIAHLLK